MLQNPISQEDFSSAHYLLQHTADNMLARLEWMTLQPNVIINLGCKTGYSADLLKKRYSKAEIVAENKIISLVDHSVDLIFANLVLPWCAEIKKMLQTWRRVLKPEGVIIFSSLGPDTLMQLHLPPEQIIPVFADMHDIGDALMQARFADPVLDVDLFTVRYQQGETVMRELRITGFLTEEVKLDLQNGLEVTYEVIYGHAFGPSVEVDQTMDEEGIVRIPLGHLRRK